MIFGARQLMFVGVLLAVPLASYFMVFKPLNSEIARAKAEIAVKNKMLDKLREATAQNQDIAKQNQETQASISSFEARLPSDKEVDMVLRDVANIAARSGLKIPQFKKSDNKPGVGIAQEQRLDVEITGDFDGFYLFLQEVEKLQRITRLHDFKITRKDDDDGFMKANLTLSIYYQSPSSTASAGVIQ